MIEKVDALEAALETAQKEVPNTAPEAVLNTAQGPCQRSSSRHYIGLFESLAF